MLYQLFRPIPNILRKSGFKMGGDFTTTIFISALLSHLFGISICAGDVSCVREENASKQKVLSEDSTF